VRSYRELRLQQWLANIPQPKRVATVGVVEFTGEYWQGKCVLELSSDNEIVDSIDINGIFGGKLIFKDRFSIETFHEDGITYFLIGQYVSSNLHDYRLFKISDQKKSVLTYLGRYL